MDSAEYYNRNAADYYDKTIDLDMKVFLDRFLEYVPESGNILDLGCGSGRDSAYFMSLGYVVTAMDGSEEMCNLASIHTGEDVLHMSFSEMDFDEVFDGIWANASLLHVPRNDFPDVLSKTIRSLKTGGILYMTFRHGDFEGMEGERYFTDYRTGDIKELVGGYEELDLIEIKKYEDVRQDRDNLWLHVIVKKI